ncbi:MAG: serine/threonine-protein kinase, partial [Polyangiales bacterium]
MAEDPKAAANTTVDGRPTPLDPPTTPGAILGTMQVPVGYVPADSMPPVMATIRGDVVPTSAPPSMPPARYQIGEEIARGGMGRVVEATDTTLGRVVALKEALSLDPDSLRRFARETRITARLEHPAIVPVHDAGVGPNGAPYYVMRKIGGKPLEKFVATGETLESRLALVPHMVAAANAIAHAHERGIVHRDIKPSNILVGDLGEVIVIDWGLAKVIDEVEDETGGPVLVDPDDSLKTRAGIVYGTPGFMAPEQLRGKPVDARCDVYALGATLYHLLSRKPPHHALTADAMMKAAVNAPPTPIGELVTGVPPELSTIIDKALAHDPDERYQDARALAEDLNRFLTGQLVASHHYTPRERVARFVRKHKVPVIAVGLAMFALIVGGWVAYLKVANERDRADASAAEARRDKDTAELQKALAEQRNEKLTLSQAWIVSDTNPTLAIAMIKPLAEKHWREVRSIGAAA